MQHLSVACGRSVVYYRYSGFLHQLKWPSRYNWSFVESIIGQPHIESETRRYMSPPWIGQPLRNICVSNDHGYVPFAVITIQVMSSFMSDHRVCSKSTQHDGCHLWSRDCLSFANTDGAITYHVVFHGCLSYCRCFMDHCSFLSFGHCVVRPSDDLYYAIGIFKLFQFVHCINVCPSIFAWSICKSPNQNLIAETS
jgi:hypothetical protein